MKENAPSFLWKLRKDRALWKDIKNAVGGSFFHAAFYTLREQNFQNPQIAFTTAIVLGILKNPNEQTNELLERIIKSKDWGVFDRPSLIEIDRHQVLRQMVFSTDR